MKKYTSDVLLYAIDIKKEDDELLSVLRCVCGQKFQNYDYSIKEYDKRNEEELTKLGYPEIGCPQCGRKLYFEKVYKVYENV